MDAMTTKRHKSTRAAQAGSRIRRGRSTAAALLLLAAALLTPPDPATASQILALVNGEPITALDVEYRSRFVEAFERRRPSRKEALDELVEQKVKLHQARKLGIGISDTEVERAIATIARNSGRTSAQLQEALQQAGINPGHFKTKLRIDIGWREALQKMAPGSFQVRDADVVAALVARGQTPSAKATQYTMRQFVFVVPRGSSDAFRASRMREAEALRAKFHDCERDVALAREYSEVVVMDPVVRISSDLPPRLQQLLEKIPDGGMTPPEPTASGIEVVAVCGRKETVADLGSRREIREELLARRVDVQEKAIIDDLRRKAIIEYR
jgi:peptidyl-prolyl cis-trans isomerase SurA